ncbi:hypothetical protein ASPBRDRAFT_302484 [Aspergillus brasiliensis CBS 101740]|uniref:Uncharacterized protein n=1 Tax=Aspergillus brasiliensis (strain CBS 101740 / IMI 381727 / IBT 21946) TaxID=767769 RepID=A0A1L9UA71_ASPBC|nr:hypothetical protein ASPBRDRAFT_302484 [Aspergillus brasiliensis CBS 101740]
MIRPLMRSVSICSLTPGSPAIMAARYWAFKRAVSRISARLFGRVRKARDVSFFVLLSAGAKVIKRTISRYLAVVACRVIYTGRGYESTIA